MRLQSYNGGVALRVSETEWPARLLELWAVVDWTTSGSERNARARIRSGLYADWAEKLCIFLGVPAYLRLPAVDLARFSHAVIRAGLLCANHPLKEVLESMPPERPEEAIQRLCASTIWGERLPRIMRLARGLSSVDMASGQDGLPPLWPRVSLCYSGTIALGPVSGPDDYSAASEITAIVETSGLPIGIVQDVMAPLSEVKSGQDVAVLSHFDPHGLTSLVPTVRTLRERGFGVRIVSSYEFTGDYARLWKSVVKRLYESDDIGALVFLDLSIDSRNPERCFEFAETANVGVKPVIWIDHHRDTLFAAKKLAGKKVTVHISSVLGTNLAHHILKREIDFLAAGGISDKDAYSVWAVSEWMKKDKCANLHAVLGGIEAALDVVAPPPRPVGKAIRRHGIDPFSGVCERLVRCDRDYFVELDKTSKERPLSLSDISSPPELQGEDSSELMNAWNAPAGMSAADQGAMLAAEDGWERRGRVVVFHTKPNAAGRFWYEILEAAMASLGAADDGMLVAPYAIAYRNLRAGKINALFLTHHGALDAPEIRLFLPRRYGDKWIGHPRAFWLDIPEGKEKRFIDAMVRKINVFIDGVFPAAGPATNKQEEQSR